VSEPITIRAVALPGEVRPGDDLAAAILAAFGSAGLTLQDGDILAVASKVVAKAEGRYLAGLAAEEAVASQTIRVLAQRRTPTGVARIVESTSGPVLAAAGVDASNLPDGAGLLALPADPDASARQLRHRLQHLVDGEHHAPQRVSRIGVVITDTLGRPWRVGQTDTAIGAAGVRVLEDLSGTDDTHGRPMRVTLRALADEIAAAADLVKGKTSGAPVALIRGLADLVGEDHPGSVALLRGPADDWFRYGHAEAARAALGVDPEDLPDTIQPVTPDDARSRLTRAITVAGNDFRTGDGFRAGNGFRAGEVQIDVDEDLPGLRLTPTGSDAAAWVALGVLAQRLVVAGWAEGLTLRIGDVAHPAGGTADEKATLLLTLAPPHP